MQPFKWIVPCAGGPGGSRGEVGVGGRAHSWIEPLTSNSPTTECCVSHTPRSPRVSNQVCEKGSGRGGEKKSTTCFSLFSFLSEFGSSVGQALVKFSMPPPPPLLPHSLPPSHSHTPAVSLSLPLPPSLPHPLSFLFFFIPLYIRLFVLGKRTPTSVEGGWLKEGSGGVWAFFFFNSESKLKQRTGEQPSDRLNAGRRGLERMTIELWRERSEALLI